MIEICAHDEKQKNFITWELDDNHYQSDKLVCEINTSQWSDSVKEERKVKEFKIGEKVRIRQWDDMAKEFGVNSLGDINCSVIFSKRMRPLCGKKATIIQIFGKNVYLENDEGLHAFQYTFTTDMIEHVKEKEIKFKVGDTVMTPRGIGEIIKTVVQFEDVYAPYLVHIFNNDLEMWFAEEKLELIKDIGKEIDEKDPNFSSSDTQTKEKDDIVDSFDKVGKVVEKTVPIMICMFLASMMSIFLICLALMILGACGIITVNYRVLGLISACMFILVLGVAFTEIVG